MDEWIFIEGMDSLEGDLSCVGRRPPEELAKISLQKKAAAFNTLGFIKSCVRFPLEYSGYFSQGDGIYVRRADVQPLIDSSLTRELAPLELLVLSSK